MTGPSVPVLPETTGASAPVAMETAGASAPVLEETTGVSVLVAVGFIRIVVEYLLFKPIRSGGKSVAGAVCNLWGLT